MNDVDTYELSYLKVLVLRSQTVCWEQTRIHTQIYTHFICHFIVRRNQGSKQITHLLSLKTTGLSSLIHPWSPWQHFLLADWRRTLIGQMDTSPSPLPYCHLNIGCLFCGEECSNKTELFFKLFLFNACDPLPILFPWCLYLSCSCFLPKLDGTTTGKKSRWKWSSQ